MKIFTGAVPFGSCLLMTSVTYIIQGKRPPRPANPILTDGLWALMQSCWDQQPKSRPRMSGVLEAVPSFISKQLERLRESIKSSPEFRLALGRFYDSTEWKDCITHLHGAALEDFVNFLDGVSECTFITFATLNFSLILCSGAEHPGTNPRTI